MKLVYSLASPCQRSVDEALVKGQERPNREPEELLQKRRRHRLKKERGRVYSLLICCFHLHQTSMSLLQQFYVEMIQMNLT